jgi:hypothetical protein
LKLVFGVVDVEDRSVSHHDILNHQLVIPTSKGTSQLTVTYKSDCPTCYPEPEPDIPYTEICRKISKSTSYHRSITISSASSAPKPGAIYVQ